MHRCSAVDPAAHAKSTQNILPWIFSFLEYYIMAPGHVVRRHDIISGSLHTQKGEGEQGISLKRNGAIVVVGARPKQSFTRKSTVPARMTGKEYIMNHERYGHFDPESGLEKYRSSSLIGSHEEFAELGLAITSGADWLDPFMTRVHHYFCRHHDYGLLGCFFSDLNYSDTYIGICVGLCAAARDQEGEDISNLIRKMSLEQRQTVLDYLPFGLDDDDQEAERWARFIRLRKDGGNKGDLDLIMEDRMEKIRWRFDSQRSEDNFTETRLLSWLTPEEVQAWDRFYDVLYEDQFTSKTFYEHLVYLLQNPDSKWQGFAMDFIANYLIHRHDYGPLSTIFEDLRFTDDSIAYCAGRADERGDHKARVILTILSHMTMQQRELLLKGFPFGKDYTAQEDGWRKYFQQWKEVYGNKWPATSSK
jgi:hypothetical protein